METRRIVDVALDPRTGGSDAIYSYSAEPVNGSAPALGDAVMVPLGNRPMLGYVIQARTITEAELGFPFDALKPIRDIVSGFRVPTALLDLVQWVAAEYLCPVPVALTPAVPPGVRERLETLILRTDQPVVEKLTPIQAESLRVLEENPEGLGENTLKKLPDGIKRALKALVKAGLAQQVLKIRPTPSARKGEVTYALTPDSLKVEKFLSQEGKRKPAQAVVVMQLSQAVSDPSQAQRSRFTLSEIRAMAGVTETTVKALVSGSLLIPMEESEAPKGSQPPTPNEYQKIAIDAITEAVRERKLRPFLLFGVTGSGKTEVFLRSAAEALDQGRQVLYLVPEIALAAQAIAQLRDRFGSRIAVLHSELTPVERLQNWLRIRNGEAAIILGARSALFAPITNLGLIVMDEEHETSYKQEQSPRYQARAVARQLAKIHGCPVVYGSATPSIESFHEAEANEVSGLGIEREKLTLLTLPSRTASAVLPTVFIDDLKEGYKRGRPGLIGPLLQEKMEATLERNEQIILFLNRRAYAPFLNCRECGHRWMCPSCAVALSYHRRDNRLRCHHCGHQEIPSLICPKCDSPKIKPFGVGTEKVEEAVSELFPQAKVARLDRDIAAKKGALEQTLAEFRANETNILVGTQLIAKGLDFPNVTMVGVIAADISLNLPDFRATERTYQLLSQVAGRAGRGHKPGEVVIQTFFPENSAIQTAARHGYVDLYQETLKERAAVRYPPFVKLINVIFTGESSSAVTELSRDVADNLRLFPGLEVIGPANCALERLQNRWRRHLLIKCEPGTDLEPIREVTHELQTKEVQILVDVDPYHLM